MQTKSKPFCSQGSRANRWREPNRIPQGRSAVRLEPLLGRSRHKAPHCTAAPRVLRELIAGYGSGYSQQSASHEVPYNQRPLFPGRDLIIQSNHEGGTRPPNSHGTQHAFSGRHRLHMTQRSDPKRNQTFLRRIQLSDPKKESVG